MNKLFIAGLVLVILIMGCTAPQGAQNAPPVGDAKARQVPRAAPSVAQPAAPPPGATPPAPSTAAPIAPGSATPAADDLIGTPAQPAEPGDASLLSTDPGADAPTTT